MIGGIRFSIRAASDLLQVVPSHAVRDPRATLLYGAGRTGVLVARSARRSPEAGVLPVGFLDDDPSRSTAGRSPACTSSADSASLERAVAETGARTLLITMPRASGAAVRRVVETAATLDLQVRTVPSVTELLDGSIDVHRLRRVKVEDLLGRPIVDRARGRGRGDHRGPDDPHHRRRPARSGRSSPARSSRSARAGSSSSTGPRAPSTCIQRELEERREHRPGSGDLVDPARQRRQPRLDGAADRGRSVRRSSSTPPPTSTCR